jgi:hypothetical protein
MSISPTKTPVPNNNQVAVSDVVPGAFFLAATLLDLIKESVFFMLYEDDVEQPCTINLNAAPSQRLVHQQHYCNYVLQLCTATMYCNYVLQLCRLACIPVNQCDMSLVKSC